MTDPKATFSLDISGVQAAKGDKEFNSSLFTSSLVRTVVTICTQQHASCSEPVKPTKKSLNQFKHAVRLAAAPGSALHTAVAAAVGGSGPAEVTLAVYALDEDQAAQLSSAGAAAAPNDLGRLLGSASIDLSKMLVELRHAKVPLQMDGRDLGNLVVSTALTPLLQGIKDSDSGAPDADSVVEAMAEPKEEEAGKGGGDEAPATADPAALRPPGKGKATAPVALGGKDKGGAGAALNPIDDGDGGRGGGVGDGGKGGSKGGGKGGGVERPTSKSPKRRGRGAREATSPSPVAQVMADGIPEDGVMADGAFRPIPEDGPPAAAATPPSEAPSAAATTPFAAPAPAASRRNRPPSVPPGGGSEQSTTPTATSPDLTSHEASLDFSSHPSAQRAALAAAAVARKTVAAAAAATEKYARLNKEPAKHGVDVACSLKVREQQPLNPTTPNPNPNPNPPSLTTPLASR